MWEDEAEAADWDFRDGVQGKWSAPFFNVGPALSLCIGKGSSGYDSLQVFMIQSRAGSRIGGDGSRDGGSKTGGQLHLRLKPISHIS